MDIGRKKSMVLNSFGFRAGRKKEIICHAKRGNVAISPTVIPEDMARSINWNGDVKTMLTPGRLRREIMVLIILS